MDVSQTIYQRLQALSIRRYGLTSLAFYQTLADLLYGVWCADTARPNFASTWSSSCPWIGQDDVTAYFLCKHVFGGTMVLLDGVEDAHFVVCEPNGEGTTTWDFCTHHNEGSAAPQLVLTPDEFLASTQAQVPGLPDTQIVRRVRLFEQRFLYELPLQELSATAKR